jgi:hypothetical protein
LALDVRRMSADIATRWAPNRARMRRMTKPGEAWRKIDASDLWGIDPEVNCCNEAPHASCVGGRELAPCSERESAHCPCWRAAGMLCGGAAKAEDPVQRGHRPGTATAGRRSNGALPERLDSHKRRCDAGLIPTAGRLLRSLAGSMAGSHACFRMLWEASASARTSPSTAGLGYDPIMMRPASSCRRDGAGRGSDPGDRGRRKLSEALLVRGGESAQVGESPVVGDL